MYNKIPSLQIFHKSVAAFVCNSRLIHDISVFTWAPPLWSKNRSHVIIFTPCDVTCAELDIAWQHESMDPVYLLWLVIFLVTVFVGNNKVGNMPYCIAQFCKVSDKNYVERRAHFHLLPAKKPALRRQWLAKCKRPEPKDIQVRLCLWCWFLL